MSPPYLVAVYSIAYHLWMYFEFYKAQLNEVFGDFRPRSPFPPINLVGPMDALNSTAFALRDSVFDALENLKLSDHNPIHDLTHSGTSVKNTLLSNKATLGWILFAGFSIHLLFSAFTVPAHLRHLPSVPIFPLLKSYLTGEVEDTRIRRLVLPFANEKKEGVVLVWALGRWMVHILDEKVRSCSFTLKGLV